MSHTEYASNRISQRIASLLPEHVRDDAPNFVIFLKAYFEFLESEIITLKSQQEIEGIALEDGQGSVLMEPATVSPSPDQDTSKLVNERTVWPPGSKEKNTASPFTVGEYLYGRTSGTVAKINVINGDILYIKSISGSGFAIDETIEGRNSLQTGVVKTYKENSILANNRLLEYSDIDHTTEHFLEYFQRDLIPSIDIRTLENKRLTIKNINDLYQKKGTEDSVKFLMRLLYGQDATIRYPDNETIYPSHSDHSQNRRMVVKMTNEGKPEETDKVTEYAADGKTIVAESNLEAVYVLDSTNYIYSLHIQETHYGTYTEGSSVTLLDRDGITSYTGTVLGVFTDTSLTSGSSTYIRGEDFNGNLLYETGDGITTEGVNIGSLYSFNDHINVIGGKLDTNAHEGSSVINGLTVGGVTEIITETAGINYEAGEMIVFDNRNTGGFGAEAIIGSTGDEITLENQTAWGAFEFTATAGQTVFSGADNNGKNLFFNDHNVKVFVNGLEKVRVTDFTFKNDNITFTVGNPMSGGEQIDVYTEFNRLLYEDGTLINFDGYGAGPTVNDGRIRSIQLQAGGTGYTTVPRAYPGGYIYFDETVGISGFLVGESISAAPSGATAFILGLEPKNNRIKVARRKTDTGEFGENESITGGTSLIVKISTNRSVASGTGADIYSYSTEIGGVGSLRVMDQGWYFSEDGVVSSTSYHPMLITTPTATLTKGLTLTGDITGSTATVQTYDADKHILTYINLNGDFSEGEIVSYNNNDEFKVVKSNRYSARGKFGGEGIINEHLLGDRSTLNADAANIQDGNYYQTHSYVVKVGESINKWRSVLKELLHPAGHIFFGEIESISNVDSAITSQFRPTIYITEFIDIDVPNAFANSERQVLLWTLDSEVDSFGTFTILDDVGIPTVETNPVTGGAISATTYDLSAGVTNPAGAASGENTEIGDSGMRSRHINLHVINSFAESAVNRYANPQGSSALWLDSADQEYFIRDDIKRPSDQGKVFLVDDSVFVEEKLCMEDGGKILVEEEACLLRMEEREQDSVKGFFGDVFIFEDGDQLRLETETTVEEKAYFSTERSIELTDKYIQLEASATDDNGRTLMEDGSFLVDEEASENGIVSIVPFGNTFDSINTIATQQTYDISYYVKNEDDDNITLEDGIPFGGSGYSSTGHDAVLDEVSNPEGLRIYDFNNTYPNTFIAELPKHERKRTNIAYSAYVKSA
jgi:hypothetical protein